MTKVPSAATSTRHTPVHLGPNALHDQIVVCDEDERWLSTITSRIVCGPSDRPAVPAVKQSPALGRMWPSSWRPGTTVAHAALALRRRAIVLLLDETVNMRWVVFGLGI